MNIAYFDEQVLLNIEKIRTPLWDKFMIGMTQLGRWEVLLIATVAATIWAWKTKKNIYVWGMLISVLAGELIVRVLKHIVARPRPEIIPQLVNADGFSFPSGHTFLAVSFYGFLIYIASREIKDKTKRRIAIGFLVLLIALIGFSRTYLGVHWLSDVLPSFILGAVWVKIVVVLIRRINN